MPPRATSKEAGYRLTCSEATQVVSTCIQYDIAEVADPEVVVVAKIRKEVVS